MTPPTINIYAVGWLKQIQRVRRMIRQGEYRRAYRFLRTEFRYTLRQARRGNWRAVKNTFNGYLAEHDTRGSRCGTGWTKRRALRDLTRHLAEVTRDGAR